eukprot:930145-Heterocapsa_arctica.AAC.1
MEEAARVAQRRLRELETIVKSQDAQMVVMEEAALAAQHSRAREAAAAMRSARAGESPTAGHSKERMEELIMGWRQKTRAMEAVIKTQDEQLLKMEAVVAETQQKMRKLETTVAAQTAQRAGDAARAVQGAEDPTASGVREDPPWRPVEGKGKKGRGRDKDPPTSTSWPRPTCYSCGKKGHLARDCEPRPSTAGPKPPCFHCGKPGHHARHCKYMVPRRINVQDSVSQSDDEGEACFHCGKPGNQARNCKYRAPRRINVEDSRSQSDAEEEAPREPEQRPEPRGESDEGELMLG